MKKELLNDVKTVFVTCRQFGDTGKGKFVDELSEWADIIGRGTGGDNAGHTSYFEGVKMVTHLIPSAIRRDRDKKINIMGSGMVINPKSLVKELRYLDDLGISYNYLRLAYNAKLITPAQIVLDRVKEAMAGKGKIGSTLKGIGPTYEDFVGRDGLIVNDLANPDLLAKKLKKHLEYKKLILKNCDSELIKTTMNHESLESGLYFNEKEIFDLDAIMDQYLKYGKELEPFFDDTDQFMRNMVGRANILGEGSQGDLLSVEYGTYPYVTSSDCTVAGLAKGIGLDKSHVDLSLGIIKGFYMSRVGGGPFPTELGGSISEEWCNSGKIKREKEQSIYGKATIDDDDEFLQGVALRRVGDEYGATTERPRRVGWLDLPLLRYGLSFNAPDLILTKLDVLNSFKTIKVCERYEYCGPTMYVGRKKLESGDFILKANPEAEILEHCRPVYKSFPGWNCDITDCKTFESLPQELKNILSYVVKQTGAKPRIISIGADREQTIYL